MADDDGAGYALGPHGAGNGRGLPVGRIVGRVPAFGPAMAGPVDEQHFGTSLEFGAERSFLIEQVSAGAMDEHQRWQVGARRTRHMDGMKPVASDIDHLSCRWMARLDFACLHPGPDRKTGQ